jgi:small subunit ribosomal protein S9
VAQPKFTNTVGRRKTATARITLKSAENKDAAIVVVNGQAIEKYFPLKSERDVALSPLDITERAEAYSVSVNVRGGGKAGQAGAIRLGIARALQTEEPELRAALKSAGFLRRDPRAVERKKAGKHKARKSTQFSKR